MRPYLIWLKARLLRWRQAAQWFVTKDFARWHMVGPATSAGGRTLTLVFIGRARVANDLAQMLFTPAVVVEEDGCWWRWQAKAALAALPPADIICREAFPLVRSAPPGGLLHQTLVDATVPLDADFAAWEHQVSASLRRNFHRSVKAGRSLRWATNVAELESFYSEILGPSAAILHGKRTHMPSLAFFRERWRPGCLVFLQSAAGQDLGGMFILKSSLSGWRLLRSGMRPEVLQDGKLRGLVTAHLIFGVVQAACAAGEQAVSLGLTPAAAGGSFWLYKKRWGAVAMRPMPDYPLCVLWAGSPRGNEELREQQLFTLKDGRLITPTQVLTQGGE